MLPAIGLHVPPPTTGFSGEAVDHSSMLEETFNSLMNPALGASVMKVTGLQNKPTKVNNRKMLDEEI